MNTRASATIAIARRCEYAALRALVIEGLRERWGEYDHAQNPDLEAFGTFYENSVVLTAKIRGRIVGCGMLVRERDTVGRIVRMSVSAKERRCGIGGKILGALLDEAGTRGYTQVVLETTVTWESAVAFYLAHGFVPKGIEGGDQQFSRALRSNWALDT